MTDTVLGNGGCGEVRVGLFRGLSVAAKCLHKIIISTYNRGVFCRETAIAFKVRHPNLFQFIGATREGNPIILTELMPTSLRKELETVWHTITLFNHTEHQSGCSLCSQLPSPLQASSYTTQRHQ